MSTSALEECSSSNDRIYIGNLPPNVSEHRLLSACRQWGKVVQFELVPTSSSGKQYCFAFVQYETLSETRAAFSDLPTQLRAITSFGNTIVRYSCKKPADQRLPRKGSVNQTASSSQISHTTSSKITRLNRASAIGAIERKLHSMNKEGAKSCSYNPAAHVMAKPKLALYQKSTIRSRNPLEKYLNVKRLK